MGRIASLGTSFAQKILTKHRIFPTVLQNIAFLEVESSFSLHNSYQNT
jgi:hypothetical protein